MNTPSPSRAARRASNAERRPATLLGEFGEGYCRICHFVEALDHEGRIIEHARGIGNVSTGPCKGSGRKPPKLTPYQSKLAAFSVNPPVALCPVCEKEQPLTKVPSLVFARHWIGPAKVCPGTGRPALRPTPVSEPVSLRRDHGSERG
jgi:hypothetical protein